MRDSKGIIDVNPKNITVRTAKARGFIVLGEEAFQALRQGICPKGNVLATAKVAAIAAAKSTPAIIPMCHPTLIEAVDVDFELNEPDKSIMITVEVGSSCRAGVEMEALVGTSVACLTIYDMLKYKSRDMVITQTRLLEKTGGKNGDYKRSD
jgi:cyclic pyranopterin phosphate synthase